MQWDDLYKDNRFCLKEAAEEVVSLLPLLRSRSVQHIHDLGFGAGRHVIYLAQQGFQIYGTDISVRGKQITEEWLEQEGLSAELKISDMTEIPYPNNFFDACICRGVITHNTVSGIKACISEMYRTIKPGGIVMCTFISRESSEYKLGREIEPNTFVQDEGVEAGAPHHFVDHDETAALISCFKTIQLYHMKHDGLVKLQNCNYISAHWVFVGEK